MKKFFFLFIALLIATGVWAEGPRAEYPRPQFERSEWINLNGEWTYEFDLVDTGYERELFKSTGFADKIIVPFAPESKLSGVEHKDFITGIWYHRTVQVPATWSENKIMLNFGAVYYESEVYIDGAFVGRHFGGSSSFSFDVTKWLSDGKKHDLVVRANSNLRGKNQGAGKGRGLRAVGIWYNID